MLPKWCCLQFKLNVSLSVLLWQLLRLNWAELRGSCISLTWQKYIDYIFFSCTRLGDLRFWALGARSWDLVTGSWKTGYWVLGTGTWAHVRTLGTFVRATPPCKHLARRIRGPFASWLDGTTTSCSWNRSPRAARGLWTDKLHWQRMGRNSIRVHSELQLL